MSIADKFTVMGLLLMGFMITLQAVYVIKNKKDRGKHAKKINTDNAGSG